MEISTVRLDGNKRVRFCRKHDRKDLPLAGESASSCVACDTQIRASTPICSKCGYGIGWGVDRCACKAGV